MAGRMIAIDGAFGGYLAAPVSGSGPGLILIHEIYGVNHWVRACADRYAAVGYAVLAPDLFWRIAPGVGYDYDEAGKTAAFARHPKFSDEVAVGDVGRAIEVLRARPECSGKVGIFGFCMGGLHAYLSAAHHDVAVAVSFYGVGIEDHLRHVGKVRCPVILHYGAIDPIVTQDKVDQVRAAIAGRTNFALHVYPEANHGFYNDVRPAFYNERAAAQAHERTMAAMRAALGDNQGR